jgi:hypothetical protein
MRSWVVGGRGSQILRMRDAEMWCLWGERWAYGFEGSVEGRVDVGWVDVVRERRGAMVSLCC